MTVNDCNKDPMNIRGHGLTLAIVLLAFLIPLLGCAKESAEAAFLKAVVRGDAGQVEKLIRTKPSLVEYKTKVTGLSALHLAAEAGHKTVVELLLTKGVAVDIRTESGETALFLAAGKGHKDVLEVLLANGADVNARNRHNYTPLWSARYGLPNKEVIELLEKHGGRE